MGSATFFGSGVLTAVTLEAALPFCKQMKVLRWFFGNIGFQSEDFQL
jgi:hypothetical protein